jgi:hypothetical protein
MPSTSRPKFVLGSKSKVVADSRPKWGSRNAGGGCGARRPLASGGTHSGCVPSSARSNGAFLQLAPGLFLGRGDEATGARTQGKVLSTSDSF